MAAKSHLRKLREAAGLSVRELARQIGESHTNLSYWERSGNLPRADLIIPIAQALGVTADELLGLAAGRARTKAPDSRLDRRLRAVQQLPAAEKRQVLAFIDALLDRERLKKRAG